MYSVTFHLAIFFPIGGRATLAGLCSTTVYGDLRNVQAIIVLSCIV
jgi:hypothetical protein